MTKIRLTAVRCIIAMAAWMMFSLGLVEVVNAEKLASVNGGGKTVFGDEVAIFAANFPTGASGTVVVASHFANFPPLIAAKVACLRIEGNQAWITAVPMQPLPDNLVIVLAVQDNGHDGDLVTVWNTRTVDQGVSSPSEICDVAPEHGFAAFPENYLSAGNITVHN